MDTVFVVGNKFLDFAGNDGVVTLAELEQRLHRHGSDALPPGARLVAGQGVREADMQRLRERLPGRAAQVEARPVRAGGLSTHKSLLCNSIVSAPRRVGDDLFEASLLLDERCELMGDHQTGQHIQGMVLVEAARQMFLAVSEEHFIGVEDATRYYFVINAMNVAFTAFVFPVDITLRYEILEKRVDNRARMFFRVNVDIVQAGRCATRVGFEFTAFHADRIEAKEREQALEVLAISRHARERGPSPVPVRAGQEAVAQ